MASKSFPDSLHQRTPNALVGLVRDQTTKEAVKRKYVMVLMATAVLAATMLAYWSQAREESAALDDLAGEQAVLAKAVASGLWSESSQVPTLKSAKMKLIRSLDETGTIRVLLSKSGSETLLDRDLNPIACPRLVAAFAHGAQSLRLTRAEAVQLGLPGRTAVAGIYSTFPSQGWSVVVVSSAARERDREIRARWRLFLSIATTAGLVLAFGGLALREQRREQNLATELALASASEQRQELLIRADKLAMLGAIASGIAHEISTPLGVIAGRTEQLHDRLGGDLKFAPGLADIAKETERIKQIIRSFLLLARGEATVLASAEPSWLVAEAAYLVEHRFRKSGVELHINVQPNLPSLSCDPPLIVQSLVNLLLNACDACPSGGKVELGARAFEHDVEFLVRDDGHGISQDAARRATEPFFTTKPADRGTGLGLAIANEIVLYHRGSLSIAPREDHRGTQASITLPTALSGNVA
jgi:signal transduction histidine kinase